MNQLETVGICDTILYRHEGKIEDSDTKFPPVCKE